jgi:hypothetical protein
MAGVLELLTHEPIQMMMFLAAAHMSAFDAVDGSSTGTEVPWMWVLLRPPRFGGAKHASGHDNWSRYR